jgi:bacteriorhodopsin
MAWYYIVAIVIAAVFVLLFVTYITNADLKMVQKVYDFLLKKQDSKNIDSKI